jgi:hypothetical protein
MWPFKRKPESELPADELLAGVLHHTKELCGLLSGSKSPTLRSFRIALGKAETECNRLFDENKNLKRRMSALSALVAHYRKKSWPSTQSYYEVANKRQRPARKGRAHKRASK